jgi:DNA-directed RNA polymerase sigma subunit (sigma70/sigma32)
MLWSDIAICQLPTQYIVVGDEQMILLTIGKGDFHLTDTEFLDANGADGAFREWHEFFPDERAEADFERVFKRDLIVRLLERARLTRLERTVVEGFAQGDNHAEIARELGVSRQRVVQALKSALRKLRNAAIELGELQPAMPSNSNANL